MCRHGWDVYDVNALLLEFILFTNVCMCANIACRHVWHKPKCLPYTTDWLYEFFSMITFLQQRSFQVGLDPNRAVQCMVSSGQGVWIACQQSSKVSLLHATTFDFLLEVSVAQAVALKLQCEYWVLVMFHLFVCFYCIRL